MKSAKFVGVLILLIIIDFTMAVRNFNVDVSNSNQEITITGYTDKKPVDQNQFQMIFKPDEVILLKGIDELAQHTVLIDVIKIQEINKGLFRSKAVMISGIERNVEWKQGKLKDHLNGDHEGKYWGSAPGKPEVKVRPKKTSMQWIEKKGDSTNTLWKDSQCGTAGHLAKWAGGVGGVHAKTIEKYPDLPGAGGIGVIDNHLKPHFGTHSNAHRESHNMLDQFGAHNHHYDDREDYEQRQFVAPYHDHSYNHDHYYNNDNAKDLNGLSDSNNNNNINTMLIIIVIGLLMIVIGCIGCLFSGVIGTAIGHFLTKRSNQQSYVDRYNKMNGVDEEI